MTGASSGGPWSTPFNASTGAGTILSVASCGCRGIKAMHGPTFNSSTSAGNASSKTVSVNTIVGTWLPDSAAGRPARTG